MEFWCNFPVITATGNDSISNYGILQTSSGVKVRAKRARRFGSVTTRGGIHVSGNFPKTNFWNLNSAKDSRVCATP